MIQKPSSFLIIQTAFLGDVVLATALIEKLKLFHPEASIDFLVRKGNESVLSGNPHLRNVLIFDKKRKFSNLMALLRQIRKQRYDVVVNVQRFASSGLLTAFSGAAYTVGFDKNPFSGLYTKAVSHLLDNSHEIERNQLLITDFSDHKAALPKIYPSPNDQGIVSEFTRKPFITIAPASIWFTKQWPAHKWISLIEKAVPKFNVCILGAAADVELCTTICSLFPEENVNNLAGRLTLLQSAALMKEARMNFVNDSGPMHLASAMDAPVTVVYCSTIPSFGFGPLSSLKRIVEITGLNCRPCGLHGYKACPLGHFKCAEDIEVELVWNDLRL